VAETTIDIEVLDEENAPASYTTETETTGEGRGQSITAPGAGPRRPPRAPRPARARAPRARGFAPMVPIPTAPGWTPGHQRPR